MFSNEIFLEFNAPTGNFILTDISGTEAISKLFQFNLTAYSENLSIDSKQLIAKSITFKINTNPQRIFNGIVSKFSASEISNDVREYHIEVMPALWLLNFTSDCQIFKNQTTLQILKTICDKFNINIDSSGIEGKQTLREYCVQYNETNLNFINRLLEQEGFVYYFRHETTRHTLVLLNTPKAYKACSESNIPYTQSTARESSIHYWRRQYQFYSGKISHTDYNFETPNTSLLIQHENTAELFSANKSEIFLYPSGHQEIDSGKNFAKQIFEAQESNHNIIEGSSNCASFTAGQKFKLTQHPDTNEINDYLLLTVTHQAFDYSHRLLQAKHFATTQSYNNTFTCIAATVPYRPQTLTPTPLITGHQTAIVVGDGQEGQEVAVDQYGRILVRFHWDRENKFSCRIRVAQNIAGKNWGMIFHPRIGQEVVIAFENGNPDRPIVIGSVYNAEQMPPHELAINQSQSGIKTKTINGHGNNEIRLEDKDGEEYIYLHAQKDMIYQIENNKTVNILKGNQTIKIASGKSVLEAEESIEFKVSNNNILINQEGIFINGKLVKINN